MIKPKIGSVVLFNPIDADRDDIRHAAVVAMVHSDECVNLAVFDDNGVPYNRQSVVLVQDQDSVPKFGQCEWMACQSTKTDEGLSDELVLRIDRIEKLLVGEAGFELSPLLYIDTVPDEASVDEELTDSIADDLDPGVGDGATGIADVASEDVAEEGEGKGKGEEVVTESSELTGLKAHALEVELESVSFLDAEGEPSKEGELIHEAEYTFTDGVSFVVLHFEHMHLVESGLSPVEKDNKKPEPEKSKPKANGKKKGKKKK